MLGVPSLEVGFILLDPRNATLPIQEFRVEGWQGNAESPGVNPKEFASLAGRLMSCPAAPYFEAGVRAVVELVCTEHGLAFRRDPFGNVIVSLGHAAAGRPLGPAA